MTIADKLRKAKREMEEKEKLQEEKKKEKLKIKTIPVPKLKNVPDIKNYKIADNRRKIVNNALRLMEKRKQKIASPTIDLDRGVLRLLTNFGDKDLNKIEIGQIIATELMNPKSFARLLTLLATYLENA